MLHSFAHGCQVFQHDLFKRLLSPRCIICHPYWRTIDHSSLDCSVLLHASFHLSDVAFIMVFYNNKGSLQFCALHSILVWLVKYFCSILVNTYWNILIEFSRVCSQLVINSEVDCLSQVALTCSHIIRANSNHPTTAS